MGRPSLKSIFLRTLSEVGGRATNGQLRQALGWDENKYWRVHQELFDQGEVERGRGRGGTVLLASSDNPGELTPLPQASTSDRSERSLTPEHELYRPILQQLERHWAARMSLDECHCEIIARQGSRATGGSWSRPDICVIGSRKFEYYPDRVFELHTFEIKAANEVTIKGVLEALAHREAATRSFVLYHTGGEDFDTFPENGRIEEVAARHGIGVFAVNSAEDIESWEEIVPAPRTIADPEAVNRFIGSQLSPDAVRKIRRWFSW